MLKGDSVRILLSCMQDTSLCAISVRAKNILNNLKQFLDLCIFFLRLICVSSHTQPVFYLSVFCVSPLPQSLRIWKCFLFQFFSIFSFFQLLYISRNVSSFYLPGSKAYIHLLQLHTYKRFRSSSPFTSQTTFPLSSNVTFSRSFLSGESFLLYRPALPTRSLFYSCEPIASLQPFMKLEKCTRTYLPTISLIDCKVWGAQIPSIESTYLTPTCCTPPTYLLSFPRSQTQGSPCNKHEWSVQRDYNKLNIFLIRILSYHLNR